MLSELICVFAALSKTQNTRTPCIYKGTKRVILIEHLTFIKMSEVYNVF